jgi:hypothetical protein
MQFMTSKKKNRVEEPTEAYEVTPKDEVTSEELHPVLVQMLEIGLRQIELGQTKPHEQVMAEMKKKYNFK